MPQASRRRQRPRRKRRPLPAWVWLAAGLVLGLGAALAFHLHQRGWRWEPSPQAEEGGRRAPAAPTSSGAGELDFDFYTLLPEMEVPVPAEEEPAREDPAGGGEGPAPARSGLYLLQVGSFRSYRDADALKARLALLGIASRIERVAVEGPGGRQLWHRVRVGPFRDPARLERVRRRLREERIPALLLRVGKGPARPAPPAAQPSR